MALQTYLAEKYKEIKVSVSGISPIILHKIGRCAREDWDDTQYCWLFNTHL